MPTQTIVAVATPRLYEEIPDLTQQAIMSSILTGRNIADELLMSNITGPVNAVKRMKNFAYSADYFYGPSIITTYFQSVANNEVWMVYLNDTYGDGEYEILSSLDLQTGSEQSMEFLTEEALLANPIVAPAIYVRTDYNPGSPSTADVITQSNGTESIHLSVTLNILTSPEHYISWEKFNAIGQKIDEGVEVYNEADGNIPGLHADAGADPNDTPPIITDELYPLVPIRVNGVDYNPDGLAGGGLEGSSSIKSMLGKININPQDILQSILDNEDGDNVDDAYIGFAIPINSDEEWAIVALAETFKLLYEANPDSQNTFNTTGARQSISIKVAEEDALDTELSFNYIASQIKTLGTGEINPGYTKVVLPGEATIACEVRLTNCRVVGSTNEIVLTLPIEGQPNQFQQLNVKGLTLVHKVTINAAGDTREVPFYGEESDDDNFVVPLFYSVVERSPKRLRSDIIFGSIVLHVYALQQVHLSWYETSLFADILLVISIVLAVYSFGTTLAAVGGAATTAAAISAIASQLAILTVTNYAVQWLVTEFGTLGAILGILLSVYASGRVDFTSIGTALNTAGYAVYSAAIKVYGVYISTELETLYEAQKTLDENYQTQLEEYEEIIEQMQFNSTFNFIDIMDNRVKPNTTTSETPQEFYDRTTSVVDLPALSNALVNNYYAAQLTLPVIDLNKQDPLDMNTGEDNE